MYRCLPAFVVAACLAAPAAAQTRAFSPDALRGALVIASPSEAVLDGRPVRLAPGLRIRGQDNMLAMSGSLLGARLLVNYTIDTQGLVNHVWILTPAEAAKQPWPATPQQAKAWRFDPVAQAWSKQ